MQQQQQQQWGRTSDCITVYSQSFLTKKKCNHLEMIKDSLSHM